MAHFDRFVRSVRAFSREFSRPPVIHVPSPVMPHRRKTFGLALGGGFARGVTHIGVIKVLEEEKIPIDFIAGTSAGALMGAFYCSGLSAGEIEEVARAVRFRDFARWTLSRYGFCSNDRMVRFLAKVLSVKSFSDLKIPLAIVATDFRTGEPVVFTEGELFDPVRASCAYPGMFLPVEFGGRQYVDGMLAYAVPTTPLRQMGADCVLGVHLSAHWASGPAPRHVFEIMGQCLSIAQARLYDLWKKDADLVLEPDMSDFSYDCFERVGELIHVGEQAMREMLPSLRTLLNLPSPAEVVREPTPVEMITASEPAGIDAVSFAS